MSEKDLPEGWVKTTVGDLCDLINGYAFKPSDWSRNGKPIIRIQNLNNPNAAFNFYDGGLAEKYQVEAGDLLFAWSGTPGTSFGAHIWNGGASWLNQHIFRVVFNESSLQKAFFKLALNQRLEDIIDRAHGGVGLRHITKGKFEETTLNLPPLNEQRRIADRIDVLQAKSSRARIALQEAKKLLQQFRQSVLHAAFTGELTAKWREENPQAEPATKLLERIRTERRKRWEEAELAKYAAKGKTPPPGWQKKYPEPVQADTTDLPDLPKGWCWASLDELSWSSGYGTSEKCDFNGEGEAVLRIPNIMNNQIHLENLKFSISPLGINKGDALDIGDMLIIRTNGSLDLVGRCAVVNEQMDRAYYFASYLIRFRLVCPDLISGWVSSLWDSLIIRHRINEMAVSAAGQNNINMKKLSSIAIPFPGVQELEILKQTISLLLNKFKDAVLQTSNAETAINALNQSILAKAFRGELVPQDPNDEPASVLLERIRQEQQSAPPARGRRKKE